MKFDATDDFCMDGQHLRKSGKLARDGSAVYHTEREEFASVVAHPGTNGPHAFTVYEKNGRIDEYTGYSLGRTFKQAPVLTAWLITRSSDRYGNTISYAYQGPGTDPSVPVANYAYPSIIEYTGSTTTPNLVANRAVYFSYETRSDWEESYASGETVLGQRLSAITVSGPTTTRTYQLSYFPDGSASVTGRSLLKSVSMTDANGGYSVQSTDFEWEFGATGFTRNETTVTDYASSDPLTGFTLADINQDGFADLIYVVHDSNGGAEYAIRLWDPGLADFGRLFETHLRPMNDYWGHYTFPRAALADSNSVGLLMWGTPGNVQNSTPFVQQIVKNPDGSLSLGGHPDFDRTADIVFPADFDGDGLADVIAGWTKNGSPTFQFYRNQTQSTLTFSGGTPITAPTGTAYHAPGNFRPFRGVDFDGDNRQEIIVCNVDSSGNLLAFTVTSDATVPYVLDPPQPPYYHPQMLSCDEVSHALYVDFNGDGLEDTLYAATSSFDNGQSYPPVAFINQDPRTIRRSETGNSRSPNIAYPANDSQSKAFILDYNLDGHPDILSTKANRPAMVSVYGLSKMPGAVNGPQFQQQDPGLQISAENALAIGDVTGDGLDDVLALESGRFIVYSRNGKKPDLLTRIVDGFGGETRFAYQPLTNPVVYDQSYQPDYSYPLRRVHGGLWVVSNHEVPNGISAQPTQYFHKMGRASTISKITDFSGSDITKSIGMIQRLVSGRSGSTTPREWARSSHMRGSQPRSTRSRTVAAARLSTKR